MQGYCDVFLRIILKRISTDARVYIRYQHGAKFEHLDVSNVIYHKFLHGAVSCTLNGGNVNVMLELKKILAYSDLLPNISLVADQSWIYHKREVRVIYIH